VITASEDATCRIWSPVNGHWQCIGVLDDHALGVNGVAIAEVDVIVSASADKTCRVYTITQDAPEETSTGRSLTTVSEVSSASFHRSRTRWRCVAVLTGHTDQLYFCAVTPDASFIATVSADTTCRVWRNLGRHEWVFAQSLEGHSMDVYGVDIAEDMSFVFTCSHDTTCKVWRRSEEPPDDRNDVVWSCLQTLEGHTEGLSSVNASADLTLLVTCADDMTSRIWGRADGLWICQQILQGVHTEAVYDAAISSDSSLIATGGVDASCYIWKRADDGTYHCIQRLAKHKKAIYSVRINPGKQDGEWIISTGSEDMSAIMWRFDGTSAYMKTQIRVATDMELATVIMLLLVACFQKVKFAFGKRVPWNRGSVKLINFTVQIAIFDLDFPLRVTPEMSFYVKTATALLSVLVFFCCALANKGKIYVKIISTMCVIPVMTEFARVFDCNHSSHMLEAAPEILCWEGIHLYITYVTCVVGCLYLCLLAPFTAAEGDIEAMPRHVLFHPLEWVRRKKDKVRGVDLGRLSPQPLGSIIAAYVNLIVHVSLPCIELLLNDTPEMLDAWSLFAVSCIPLCTTLLFPPMEDRVITKVVACSHALAVHAFGVAIIAVMLNDRTSLLPTTILYGGWIAIIVCWWLWVCRAVRQRAKMIATSAREGSNLPHDRSSIALEMAQLFSGHRGSTDTVTHQVREDMDESCRRTPPQSYRRMHQSMVDLAIRTNQIQ